MQPFDANTLYYTFSTIAQAGAGAFAFVSAFVLYRLQSVDQRMASAANHLASQTRRENTLTEARGYIAGRQYSELLQSFQVSMLVIQGDQSLLASWQLLNREKKIGSQLVTGFKLLVWPTVALLSGSIAALCLVDTLKQSQCVAALTLLVLSSLFIALLLFKPNYS